MQLYDRRSFLKTTLATAGALAASRTSVFGVVEPRSSIAATSAADRVPLGKTGIKASFLAQGTGYNGYARSSDHTRMGQEAFTRLLRYDLDEGINFIDMADLYGSHGFVKKALEGVPRDKCVLLSKIWPRKEDWVTPSGGAVQEMDRFRKELGVEMVDIVLVHCAVNDKWAKEYAGIRDELSTLKGKGVVRAVGVSCHDFGALKLAATDPWVDVIFARINNRGGEEFVMDSSSENVAETLRLARSKGKAVVGMKIFGAGKLTKPDQMDASLKYVIDNGLVDAMTIGMRKTEETADTIKRIDQALKA